MVLKASVVAAVLSFAVFAHAGGGGKPKSPKAPAAPVMQPAPHDFLDWKLTDTFEPVKDLKIFRYVHGPSGLSVLISPKLGIDVVAFVVSYNVGSRYETKGRTGLAHLFEHMMFRGTDSFAEPFKQLSEWGDSFNAYTSFDLTLYYELTPKAVFADVVMFEAERMRKLKITKEGFDKERGAVVSERKMRTEDSPMGRLFWELHLDAFKVHPYQVGPIGWQDDLNATSFQDALDFYKRFYAPNRAVVSIVGDVQVSEALALLEKNFGSFTQEKWVEPKVPQESKTRKAFRRVLPLKSESVMLADAALGLRMNDPNVPGDSLFCTLLADPKQGFLSNELVETGLARSVSGDCSPNVDPGLNTILVVANPGVSVKAIEEAYDKGLAAFGAWLTPERVEKAKMFYLSAQWENLRDPAKLAEQIARSETTTGDALFDFKFIEAALKVTPAQVRARYELFRKAPKTRLIVEPAKTNAPFVKR